MSEGPLAAPQLPSGGKPRVLIVDDQRNMRTTTAFVLQQAGYDVAEAESGEAALSRLLAEPFEVVLTDLKMAPLDGLAVLRGALEIAPATQVILMTGPPSGCDCAGPPWRAAAARVPTPTCSRCRRPRAPGAT